MCASKSLGHRRAGALGIAAALSLAACASLGNAPASGTHLTGNWMIEKTASEAAGPLIDHAVAAARARLRRRERERFGGATPDGGAGGADREAGGETESAGSAETQPLGELLPPDFSALRTGLLTILQAPAHLRVQVEPGSVLLARGALPAQQYEAGQSFYRSDVYGTGTVDAGWSGVVFVVRTHYGNGATLTENYAVDPHSGNLTLTRRLNDPIVGRLELRSVYRRG